MGVYQLMSTETIILYKDATYRAPDVLLLTKTDTCKSQWKATIMNKVRENISHFTYMRLWQCYAIIKNASKAKICLHFPLIGRCPIISGSSSITFWLLVTAQLGSNSCSFTLCFIERFFIPPQLLLLLYKLHVHDSDLYHSYHTTNPYIGTADYK